MIVQLNINSIHHITLQFGNATHMCSSKPNIDNEIIQFSAMINNKLEISKITKSAKLIHYFTQVFLLFHL